MEATVLQGWTQPATHRKIQEDLHSLQYRFENLKSIYEGGFFPQNKVFENS